MTWTELEIQARRLVDQLQRELRDVDLVRLEASEAAEMAGQLLDRAALRELREDDPAFVREVAREEGLDDVLAHEGEAAHEAALRAAVLERMCGAMFVRLLETRGPGRSRRRREAPPSHTPAG